MIPEGLQYASIASIVAGIKSLGMNAIRLTFAIEMIDDVIDGGGDVTLSAAFNKALGTTNGPVVYKEVLAKNPQFSASTTRLQVSHVVLKLLDIRDIDTAFRSMMRSLPSAISSRSTSTLTTTCQKVDGVAPTPTEMAGSETPI